MADYSLKEIFGGKDTQAYADYKAGQKQGKWSDYNSYVAAGGNSKQTPSKALDSNIQSMVSANMQAIQPAVQSYQSQIPETQQAFSQRREQLQAEKSPLLERYENLLAKVKSGYEGQRTLATTTTNNELGRRGIVSSSGIADREMQQSLSPIFEAESQATADVGFEREAQMRNLENMISNMTLEEQSALRQITNAMAGLQSQAGMSGISGGLQVQNMANQANQFGQNLGFQNDAQKAAMDQFNKTFGLQQQQYQSGLDQFAQQMALEQQKANQASSQNSYLSSLQKKLISLLNPQKSSDIYDISPSDTNWILRK